MLIYVRALDFDECPDYEEIIKVFDTVYQDIIYAEGGFSAEEEISDLD
jgi:hypothetical protein